MLILNDWLLHKIIIKLIQHLFIPFHTIMELIFAMYQHLILISLFFKLILIHHNQNPLIKINHLKISFSLFQIFNLIYLMILLSNLINLIYPILINIKIYLIKLFSFNKDIHLLVNCHYSSINIYILILL